MVGIVSIADCAITGTIPLKNTKMRSITVEIENFFNSDLLSVIYINSMFAI